MGVKEMRFALPRWPGAWRLGYSRSPARCPRRFPSPETRRG